MLTEKEQDSINKVLKNHIIEYNGDFLFDGDDAKFYFKIKLDGTRKMISVGEKSYWIEGHKKYLVGKISLILEDQFPHVDKGTIRRTIKFYLDLMK